MNGINKEHTADQNVKNLNTKNSSSSEVTLDTTVDESNRTNKEHTADQNVENSSTEGLSSLDIIASKYTSNDEIGEEQSNDNSLLGTSSEGT